MIKMWSFIFNFLVYSSIGLITVINTIALKEFYWDSLREHVHQIQEVHELIKSWKIVFMLYVSMGLVYFKQWLHKTAHPLSNGNYMLTHYIDGHLIKIIIKPASRLPVSVVDEDYEDCYLDQALPFLRFEQVQFSNKTINVDKPLILTY
ncbi:MAG: hypothetical protein ACRDAQ_00795 [Cetobacterium sp.]